MEIFFWILLIIIILIYFWYKNGIMKTRKYHSEVNRILNDILGIDTNSITNKKFAGSFAYYDLVGESYVKLQSVNFCAISISLQYWVGILETQKDENIFEAKTLKPKILSYLQESYKNNKVQSNTEEKIRKLISDNSLKYDLN